MDKAQEQPLDESSDESWYQLVRVLRRLMKEGHTLESIKRLWEARLRRQNAPVSINRAWKVARTFLPSTVDCCEKSSVPFDHAYLIASKILEVADRDPKALPILSMRLFYFAAAKGFALRASWFQACKLIAASPADVKSLGISKFVKLARTNPKVSFGGPSLDEQLDQAHEKVHRAELDVKNAQRRLKTARAELSKLEHRAASK